jgi:hypothetical protein
MTSKISINAADGSKQEVEIDATIYKAAADSFLTVPQYLNRRFPTDSEKHGSAFEQMLAATGMFMHRDGRYGIRPPSMADVIEGTAVFNAAGVVVRDASPASRILFPAVILEVMENKLVDDKTSFVALYDSLVAIKDSINGDKFEQPILNFSKAEAGRRYGIAQNALPPNMLTITASDVARRIPTISLGLEITDEAKRATTLDFVTMALTRQWEVERAERVGDKISAMLNGDVDNGQAALSSITAQSLDAAVTTAGTITQKAWMKFLAKNHFKRSIDWVICDLAAALAIENRTGKPTVDKDDATSTRIEAQGIVSNPMWKNVKIFLVDDGVVPANTIVGLDSRYAIRRVTNNQAEYAAVEQFVLKKSEAMRFDMGEIEYRLFDEAWEVMTLTV